MIARRFLAGCTTALALVAGCSDRPADPGDPGGDQPYGGTLQHRDAEVLDFTEGQNHQRFVLPQPRSRGRDDQPTLGLTKAPDNGYTGVSFEGRAVIDPPRVGPMTVQLTDIHVSDEAGRPLALAVSNYAGDQVAGALQVFDVSDPYQPRLESELLYADAEYASVTQKGAIAYAVGNDEEMGILDVFNVASTMFPNHIERVYFEAETAVCASFDDSKLYVVTGEVGGLHVMDLSDPFRPVEESFVAIDDARDVDLFEGTVLVLTGSGLVFVVNGAVDGAVAVDGLPAQAPSRALVVGRECFVSTDDGMKAVDLDTRQLANILDSDAGTANGLATDDGVLFFRANGEAGLQVLHRGDDSAFTELGVLDLANAGSANSASLKGAAWFSGDGRGGVMVGGFAYDIYDDFEGDLVNPYPWVEVSGDWILTEIDGNMVMTCPLQGNPGDRRVFWGQDVSWTNFQVDARVYLGTGNGCGIYFRANDVFDDDNQDGYIFQYDPGYRRGAFLFRKIHDGHETRAFGVRYKRDIPEFAGEDWYGVWRDYRLVVEGNQMRAWVDGVFVTEAEDDEFVSGSIGLRIWSSSEAWFDDIRVTELP